MCDASLLEVSHKEMMKNKNEVTIRMASAKDNIKQIAQLIYCSDRDIYGAMFGNERNAGKVLQELIYESAVNISIKNLVVAACNKDIVGILCFVENDYFDDRKNYKDSFQKLKIPIPKHFDEVYEVYWKKLIQEDFSNTYYISNIAVASGYQNCGICKRLLQYFIESYSGKPIKLDVVKENKAAICAYMKSGFRIRRRSSIVKNAQEPYRMVFEKEQPDIRP